MCFLGKSLYFSFLKCNLKQTSLTSMTTMTQASTTLNLQQLS